MNKKLRKFTRRYKFQYQTSMEVSLFLFSITPKRYEVSDQETLSESHNKIRP